MDMLDPENLDEKSRKLFDYFLSRNNMSVFCKDLNSKFFNCNDRFLNDCGMDSLSSLVGRTDYDLIWTKEEAAHYRLIDKEVIENNVYRLGIVEEQTDSRKRKRWIETNKVPLHAPDGKVIGLLGYYIERL